MECINKTSMPAHAKTAHSTVSFFSFYAIFFFNKGHQFIKEKIFVKPVTARTVCITPFPGISIGHNDDHGSAPAFADRFIRNVLYFAKLYPTCLVVATAM